MIPVLHLLHKVTGEPIAGERTNDGSESSMVTATSIIYGSFVFLVNTPQPHFTGKHGQQEAIYITDGSSHSRSGRRWQATVFPKSSDRAVVFEGDDRLAAPIRDVSINKSLVAMAKSMVQS
ncbi:hypothetical protein ACLOJK_019056 [Asimina triloba]